MQVVYSGGSTPTPSPRIQRKEGYRRPLMRGYMTHVNPQVFAQRSRQKLTEGDITLRDSIPAMSKSTAITCLILNIILPGSGTLTAGLSVLCCSHVRPKDGSKFHCILLNAGVALLQFMLTFLFLLGWIWSIMWGVTFVTMSNKIAYQKNCEDDSEQGKVVEHLQKKISQADKIVNKTRNSNTAEITHNKSCEHHHDSRHQEQYHHYLEHYRRYTLKESSQTSQSYDVVDSIPSSIHISNRQCDKKKDTTCVDSQVPDRCVTELNILPEQSITEYQHARHSDTCVIVSESTCDKVGKTFTSYTSTLLSTSLDNDISSPQLRDLNFKTSTEPDTTTLVDVPEQEEETNNTRIALLKC